MVDGVVVVELVCRVRTHDNLDDPLAHQSVGAYRIFFVFLSTHTVIDDSEAPATVHVTSNFDPHDGEVVRVIAIVARSTHADTGSGEDPSFFHVNAVWDFVHFAAITNDRSDLLMQAVTVLAAAWAGTGVDGRTVAVRNAAHRRVVIGTRIQLR